MAKAQDEAVAVRVKFGRASIGEKTANLGAVAQRAELTPTQADRLFADSRMEVTLEEEPDQGKIEGTEEAFTLVSMVDVKGYRGSATGWGWGMIFNRQEIDVGKLARLANQPGVATVRRIGATEGVAHIDQDDGGGDGDLPYHGDDDPPAGKKRVRKRADAG